MHPLMLQQLAADRVAEMIAGAARTRGLTAGIRAFRVMVMGTATAVSADAGGAITG